VRDDQLVVLSPQDADVGGQGDRLRREEVEDEGDVLGRREGGAVPESPSMAAWMPPASHSPAR